MKKNRMNSVVIATINGVVSPMLYFILLPRLNSLNIFIFAMIIHNILLWSLFFYAEK